MLKCIPRSVKAWCSATGSTEETTSAARGRRTPGAERAGEEAALVDVSVELDDPGARERRRCPKRIAAEPTERTLRPAASAKQSRGRVPPSMKPFACRFCGTHLAAPVVDLGMSPLCESYVAAEHLDSMEPFYPLHVWVCHAASSSSSTSTSRAEDIFTEYAYFSSFSSSWLEHAEDYVAMITERLGSGRTASSSSSPATTATSCSTSSSAASLPGHRAGGQRRRGGAVERGVPTEVSLLRRRTAARLAADGRLADLVLGNNVLAQVPDLNDFVAGIPTILAPMAP